MKTFKQKALEALESLVAQDVPGESKIINIHNNTVHLCISRIEAIEEDDNVWIPVEERLPENSNDILLKGIFGFVTTAIGRYHHTGENGFVVPDTIGFHKVNSVTHWMPLPPTTK